MKGVRVVGRDPKRDAPAEVGRQTKIDKRTPYGEGNGLRIENDGVGWAVFYRLQAEMFRVKTLGCVQILHLLVR